MKWISGNLGQTQPGLAQALLVMGMKLSPAPSQELGVCYCSDSMVLALLGLFFTSLY